MESHSIDNAPITALLAESRRSVQKLLATNLSALGIQVTPASDGVEAIASVARDKLALVFMQENLNIVDGTTVVTALRAKGLTVPIYVLTDSEEEDQYFLQKGFTGVLRLPLDNTIISEIIERSIKSFHEQGHSISIAKESPELNDCHIDMNSVTSESYPCLNVQAIQNYVDALGADEVSILVQQMQSNIHSRRTELIDAIANKDVFAIRKIAHSISGIVDSYGLKALADPINSIHNMAKNADISGITSIEPELLDCMDRTLKEAESFSQQLR